MWLPKCLLERCWASISAIYGLPCWLSSKESACSAGELGDGDSISGLVRSCGGGRGNPRQYSRLENPTARGAWQATVYGVAKIGHDWATELTWSNWIHTYQWYVFHLDDTAMGSQNVLNWVLEIREMVSLALEGNLTVFPKGSPSKIKNHLVRDWVLPESVNRFINLKCHPCAGCWNKWSLHGWRLFQFRAWRTLIFV